MKNKKYYNENDKRQKVRFTLRVNIDERDYIDKVLERSVYDNRSELFEVLVRGFLKERGEC